MARYAHASWKCDPVERNLITIAGWNCRMQLNDLNPLINYVLLVQFRYKMWRPLIALIHIQTPCFCLWTLKTGCMLSSQKTMMTLRKCLNFFERIISCLIEFTAECC